jgi:SF3a60/Prp9 C-terminal
MLTRMDDRKNFERHFQESRHAFGMRALGLPNTKHFHEITKIEDAMARASFTALVLFRMTRLYIRLQWRSD